MLTAQTLTVLPTNRCSAACDHCCMNSGPDRLDCLSTAEIKHVISDLHRFSPLRLVVFAGGEPTLAGRVLRESISFCTTLGIRTRLVTNASWARSFDSARAVLENLRESGLNEINFSADDYHAPFIPFERIIYAWRGAKGLGFKAVIIANSSGRGALINPGYIMERLGEHIPVRFSHRGKERSDMVPSQDGTYYGISNAATQRLQRASAQLDARQFSFRGIDLRLVGPCPHVIRRPALSAKGHLLGCCGFELDDNAVLDLGVPATMSASQRLRDAQSDEILIGLSVLGPAFLLKVLEEMGGALNVGCFGSVCEICSAITKDISALHALRECRHHWWPLVLTARSWRQAWKLAS